MARNKSRLLVAFADVSLPPLHADAFLAWHAKTRSRSAGRTRGNRGVLHVAVAFVIVPLLFYERERVSILVAAFCLRCLASLAIGFVIRHDDDYSPSSVAVHTVVLKSGCSVKSVFSFCDFSFCQAIKHALGSYAVLCLVFYLCLERHSGDRHGEDAFTGPNELIARKHEGLIP